MTSTRHDHDGPLDLGPAVALFRGLADPTRLAIVHELARGERRIVDLTRLLGLAQSTVSAHVACLRGCGLVDGRTVGRQSIYRLARPELLTVLGAAEELLAATGNAVDLCPVQAGGSPAEGTVARAPRPARRPARTATPSRASVPTRTATPSGAGVATRTTTAARANVPSRARDLAVSA